MTAARTDRARRLPTAILTVLVLVVGLPAGGGGAFASDKSAPALLARSSEPVVARKGPSPTSASKNGPVFVDSDTGRWTTCEGLPGCQELLSRGDPAYGPADATFRFTAGTRFAPHFHTSPEHVVGIAGIMQWTVGGKTYYLGPGDFLYYPGKAVHSGRCLPGAQCVFHVYDERAYDFHPAAGGH